MEKHSSLSVSLRIVISNSIRWLFLVPGVQVYNAAYGT